MNWIWIILVLLDALEGNPKSEKAVQDLRVKEFNEDMRVWDEMYEVRYITLKIRQCFQYGETRWSM